MEGTPARRFADWPGAPPVPNVVRGVYTLWKADQLVYVGLAGLGELPDKKPKKPWGLHRRLAAHASGRRALDQVTCLLADRFVLDTLEEEDLDIIVSGQRSMDDFIKAWIGKHLTYRFTLVETTAVARDLEQRIRRGELAAGPPFLNPLRTVSPVLARTPTPAPARTAPPAPPSSPTVPPAAASSPTAPPAAASSPAAPPAPPSSPTAPPAPPSSPTATATPTASSPAPPPTSATAAEATPGFESDPESETPATVEADPAELRQV